MGYLECELTIGSRIKAARKSQNMTQKNLSDKTGIECSVLSAYENGKKTPGLTNLAVISRALETTIDELYFGNQNESFIHAAADEAELIVNCYYQLWVHHAIDDYSRYSQSPGMYGALLATEAPGIIVDLLNSLEEFDNNKSTYENPEEFLKSLKGSFVNRIRSAQENRNKKPH